MKIIYSHLYRPKYKEMRSSAEDVVKIARRWLSSENCCYCNQAYTDDNTKSMDHIIPISKGGDHKDENINICCVNCNYSKSALLLQEWINLCKRVVHNSN